LQISQAEEDDALTALGKTRTMAHAAFVRLALALGLAGGAMLGRSQYLFYHPPKGHKPYTAIYGEVTVLADNPGVYYCACDWWPAAKAGGYTGIQHLGKKGKRIIFSVWDTGPDLHPSVIEKDPRVVSSRFKGEGSGAHTHMDYEWQIGQTYRYYATKRPDDTGKNIIVSVYFYDETQKRWLGEARILSPIGDRHSVDTFDANLRSFLENLRDKNDKQYEVPKLALYKLWAGTGPDDLKLITSADGKPEWGVMNDSFFIGEGDRGALQKVMDANVTPGKTAQFGVQRVRLTIPDQPISEDVLNVLRQFR
jgi:hypothetical protein